MILISLLIALISAVILIPVFVFCIEIWAALSHHNPTIRQLPPTKQKRGRIAILMPAHNEESVLAATLDNVKKQLQGGDRLLVVADNCSDQTADIARSAKVEVIERQHDTQRGKGFALDFGVQHLSQNPPDFVVIVDSDCTLEAGCLDRLVATAQAHNRPVQALYLMRKSPKPGLTEQVRLFAWVVKNQVRALGMKYLQMPCPLMGTGMLFPWELIKNAALANDCLVEDLKLGLEFVIKNQSPVFCAQALVTSEFPQDNQAAEGQRKRWEHGHLAIIGSELPGLLKQWLKTPRKEILYAALDLCVPPLALLSMLLVVWWFVLILASLFFKKIFFIWLIFTLSTILFFCSVLAAWVRFGRRYLNLTALLSIPFYIIKKIPLYLGFINNRQKSWVRTKRD